MMMNLKSLWKYFRSSPPKNTPTTTKNNESGTFVEPIGTLSRIDLLTSLTRGDAQTTTLIASELGLEYQAKQNKKSQQEELFSVTHNANQQAAHNNKPLNSSRTAQLKVRYWQLTQQKKLQDDDEEHLLITETDHTATVDQPAVQEAPTYPTLSCLKDLRSRVFPLLETYAYGKQQLDITETINKLSRAEWLSTFPQKPRQHSLQTLHIMDDRQLALTPYWYDHTWITEQIFQRFATYQISRAVLLNGETEPLRINEQAELEGYQYPPAYTPILLLSDLGRLSPYASGRLAQFNDKQQQYWRLINTLISKGYPVIVITPCHPQGYPCALRKKIELIAWEHQATPLPEPARLEQQASNQQINQWVDTLLTLASLSIRLEPALLRSLRLGLRQYGECIPAAIEALVWQHLSIKEPHNVAATWHHEANTSYRLKLGEASIEYQTLALQTLQQWRAILPEEIWTEELLSIEPLLADEVQVRFKCEINQASAFIQRIIDQDCLQGNKATAYQAWVARLERRVSQSAVQTGQARRPLQTLLYQLDAKPISQSGHVLDPDLLTPSRLPKKKAWLCQVGSQWAVSQHVPTAVPKQKSSVLAPIEYARCELKWVKRDGSSGVFVLPETLSSDLVLIEQSEALAMEDKLTLRTDYTEFQLQAIERPEWASEMGRDAYGMYADLVIPNRAEKRLIQRFRWIVAGTFMMGSPADEVDRYEKGEDYHRVMVSKGYWLADTTVTQAIWEAVMGDNPSDFKHDNNPVENVSWNDIQPFIQKINQGLSKKLGSIALQLPTEAQWEYACRAGTTTPFSFGENITPEQVNYNGNYPYADGEKGLNRGKTVMVRFLPINPWGLYEMHGNVWEWCADAWKESLGTGTVVDPYQQGNENARRVLRGGSWIHLGWGVRSAHRSHYAPDNRISIAGFRLSLGRELQSR